MLKTWMDEYLLKNPGTEKDFKEEWDAFRYLVGGKMFAMVGGDKEGRPILTLKCDPLYGDELRTNYPDKIVPGYYMNKVHWNSLYLESDVPDEVFQTMADMSYRLVLAALPKKVREGIVPSRQKDGSV